MQERGRELGYVVRRKLAGREDDSPAVQRAAKRVLDPVAAALGLVVLSPVYAAIAVAVVVDSGRPVLFVSARAGKDGRPFRMLKFRTMVPDAIRVGLEKGSPRPLRDRQGRSSDHARRPLAPAHQPRRAAAASTWSPAA